MTWKMHFPMYVYGMVIETPVHCFCVAVMVAVYMEREDISHGFNV